MMDAVLNLPLNDESVAGLAEATEQPRLRRQRAQTVQGSPKPTPATACSSRDSANRSATPAGEPSVVFAQFEAPLVFASPHVSGVRDH
jgi:hypothetical protein